MLGLKFNHGSKGATAVLRACLNGVPAMSMWITGSWLIQGFFTFCLQIYYELENVYTGLQLEGDFVLNLNGCELISGAVASTGMPTQIYCKTTKEIWVRGLFIEAVF